MTTLSKLLNCISSLHQARIARDAAKVSEQIAKDHLKNIPEYIHFTHAVEQRKNAERAVEAQEADVRQVAVDLHKETGELHFPGVNIGKGKELVFTDAEAIDYCIKHGYANFLQLDQKAFDKWALSNCQDEKIQKQMELTFITVVDVPTARIDSNLEKAKETIVTEAMEVKDEPTQ